MNIQITKNNFIIEDEIKAIEDIKDPDAAVSIFIGKVRNKKNGQVILSIDIEFYEKMALFQIKKIIRRI